MMVRNEMVRKIVALSNVLDTVWCLCGTVGHFDYLLIISYFEERTSLKFIKSIAGRYKQN